MICRQALEQFLKGNNSTANAGLLLRRGMTHYDAPVRQDAAGAGGKAKQDLISRIANLKASALYEAAFKRWQEATSNKDRFSTFQAPLLGRLYIGLTRESALETGITVSHAYGMPMIPGSALKGLSRNVARANFKDRQPELVNLLFGAETESKDTEAGSVIFHDAWWVPEGDPFACEVVTPHHTQYYAEGSQDATDFDSPIPAPQIAARGAFYFVIEGAEGNRRLASKLLRMGLENLGVGGKTRSGYGYFDVSAA